MTLTEAKQELIKFVIAYPGISRDGNYIQSITELVHKGQFCIDGEKQFLKKFFTWIVEDIDGQTYIFVNNLFIHPSIRNKNTLLSIRKFLRNLYPNSRGYWYNKKRDCLKYRR